MQRNALEQVQSLLQDEQKVLEAIFPRHVIEYLTERANDQAIFPTSATSATSAAAGTKPKLRPNPASVTAGKLAALATSHECVTVLFADIVGFTAMSERLSPMQVMRFLNAYFSKLDALVDIYKVYKVETIGDCYMVAGGLMQHDADGFVGVLPAGETDPLHALRVFSFAKAMLEVAATMRMPEPEPESESESGPQHPDQAGSSAVLIRVGINSGPVMSGMVGSKMPRFCLFGDTVNTASRMESTGTPGTIHASAVTRGLLAGEASWEATGGVEVKGKGRMQTYLYRGSAAAEDAVGQMQRVLGIYL